MNSRQDYIMDTRLNAAILHRYGSSINNFSRWRWLTTALEQVRWKWKHLCKSKAISLRFLTRIVRQDNVRFVVRAKSKEPLFVFYIFLWYSSFFFFLPLLTFFANGRHLLFNQTLFLLRHYDVFLSFFADFFMHF